MLAELRQYVEARCIPEPNSGCWLWLLSTGSHGYGNAVAPWAKNIGVPKRAVARDFSVNQALVQRIASGHVWKHISVELRPLTAEQLERVDALLASVLLQETTAIKVVDPVRLLKESA